MNIPEIKGQRLSLRDFASLLTPEKPNQSFQISGPTKELTIALELDSREILMDGTIVLKQGGENADKVPNETTVLLFTGFEMSLLAANKNKLDFRTVLNATDPSGKIQNWIREHLDNEENSNSMNSFVPKEQVATELERIQKFTASLRHENLSNIQIEHIENMAEHEENLRRRVSAIRNLQKK